ncbi:unnamed protein product [Malassezia sympodialis ATCC 42132]|uniref:uncharacterized protein n=1 Tax=Malassezia sympodialis (strain ATCC 42132) TaxID=1230383 RepID=UPI0002C2A8D4|nr:uncharacterized protein MSY001_2329 [Malassezia sympodialis ATCC 42132]CCU99623.1 unnamed protein product [Malassezia sympodialis ATCC 42132]|eukprot:XP_018740862.1 uncharacterized protein MSY001_2329 [Malassezia sympodialis ATCC 42132]
MRRSAVAAVLHDWQNNEEQRSYHEPLRQLATGGGYGILTDQKPFRPPLKQTNAPQSLRKRPRVNYAGLEGASENDEAYKEEKEMPKKKNSLEGVYKGIDASGVSLNADRRKWAVYQAKPDAIKSKFTIPSMKNERGEFIENRLTHAALGVRKPIEVPPRPLYDPMSEHAIVLFDPTVDDKDAEQERERLRTAFEEQRKVLDRGPHKSLARILGLDKPKLVIEEKVPVVIDPRLGRILRPHQVEGVKFLYRCTTGMVSENAHGCIMADEMGLGKTLQCITLMWTLLRQSPRAGKGTIDKAIVEPQPLAPSLSMRRVILSGTPIQNDLSEYFSLINFAIPDILGNRNEFRKRFEIDILRGRDAEATDKEKQIGREKLQELSGIVSQFIIRRTNDILSKYLPLKYEHVVFCNLSPFQLDLYHLFLKAPAIQKMLKGAVSQPLKAIGILKKLCNHPDLLNLPEDLEGSEEYFPEGYKPGDRRNALARVWRDGQKKTCFVYRFVATGSIEEKILQRQSHKQSLSSCVVDDDLDAERHFSGEILRALFQYKSNTVSDTHDTYKCKRCRDGRQVIPSQAMLYGDTSTEPLEQMQRLSILMVKDEEVYMNDVFRRGMVGALTGSGDSASFGKPCADSKHKSVPIEFLDEYARTQWETILYFMVGSEHSSRPRNTVLFLLQRAGLMQRGSAGEDLNITSLGFQFLLQDVNSQLWALLLHYLSMAEERNMDLVEILSFFFTVGGLELGRAYETQGLSTTQMQTLEELSDYGLVYRPSKSVKYFFPTRLASTLTSTASPSLSRLNDQEEQGYLILETNYRVYAYTCTCQLTRHSVKSALNKGITADQIITYMSHHAHPQMYKNRSTVRRTVLTPGNLYTDFTSMEDYFQVRDYAKSLGVLQWESEAKRMLFVTAEGHARVREFIQRRRV